MDHFEEAIKANIVPWIDEEKFKSIVRNIGRLYYENKLPIEEVMVMQGEDVEKAEDIETVLIIDVFNNQFYWNKGQII